MPDPKIVFLNFVISAFGGYIAPQTLKKINAYSLNLSQIGS